MGDFGLQMQENPPVIIPTGATTTAVTASCLCVFLCCVCNCGCMCVCVFEWCVPLCEYSLVVLRNLQGFSLPMTGFWGEPFFPLPSFLPPSGQDQAARPSLISSVEEVTLARLHLCASTALTSSQSYKKTVFPPPKCQASPGLKSEHESDL